MCTQAYYCRCFCLVYDRFIWWLSNWHFVYSVGACILFFRRKKCRKWEGARGCNSHVMTNIMLQPKANFNIQYCMHSALRTFLKHHNADSFYKNITNTTFQKIPIPHLTHISRNSFTNMYFASCSINWFYFTWLKRNLVDTIFSKNHK